MLAAITALAGAEIRDYAQRNVRAAMLVALGAVFAVAAAGYGLSALSVWLTPIYGEITTRLMIAGGLLFVAVIALIAAMVARRPSRRQPMQDAAALIGAPAALELAKSLVPSLGKTLPVALVAGVVVGRVLASRK